MTAQPNPIQSEQAAISVNQDLRQYADLLASNRPAPLKTVLNSLLPNAAKDLLHELQVHQIELEMQNEELRQMQATLETARARYFDLYELAPVGYLTLSETGLIQEANLTIAAMLGAPRSHLIKQALSRFILAADQDVFYLHRKRLLADKSAQSFELRLVKSDGHSIWVRLEINRLAAESGEALFRVVLSDISAAKQAEQTLTEAKMLAQTSERLKSEFLASISHEIRTPMNVIIGFSELLQLQPVTADMRNQLNHIHNASHHLLDILDHILDFSRLESRQLSNLPRADARPAPITNPQPLPNTAVVYQGYSDDETNRG